MNTRLKWGHQVRDLFAPILCVVAWNCVGAGAAEPQIVERVAELSTLVPNAAYDGVGNWRSGEFQVATGHSISIDALGAVKGRRTERELAEEDARNRLAQGVAITSAPDFSADAFEIQASFKGVRVVATYRLPGRDGLFLIALAKTSEINVQVSFAPAKARAHGIALFGAQKYADASAIFAMLSTRGVQDAETLSWARAASAYVNLDAGFKGGTRTRALETLAVFHEKREQWDDCMKFYYQLYESTDSPDRELLEKLATVADRTHRSSNATAFRKEIERRWPHLEKP